MNIFFSWSGDTSRELAEVFSKWLPKVIQKADTFFEKSEMHKLVRSIDNIVEGRPMTQDQLNAIFEKWWPDLDEEIREILDKSANTRSADQTAVLSSRLSESDYFKEMNALLEIMRRTTRDLTNLNSSNNAEIHNLLTPGRNVEQIVTDSKRWVETQIAKFVFEKMGVTVLYYWKPSQLEIVFNGTDDIDFTQGFFLELKEFARSTLKNNLFIDLEVRIMSRQIWLREPFSPGKPL